MDPEFAKLNGQSIFICQYCHHLKTIEHFLNYNKNEYTILCDACRDNLKKTRMREIVRHFCIKCECYLTSPKILIKQCIKQHEKTAKHIRNVKGYRDG